MTAESFNALCLLNAQLEWNREISRVRRKGEEETGWLEMTGCNYLYKRDIDALKAVIVRREQEDRKRLDAAAKRFVETWLKYDD